jgi:DNA repair photolyase
MLHAIRTSKLTAVEAIQALVNWPTQPSAEWSKGFLAGIFDAEGSYSRGILRIANTDPAINEMILAGMERFGFDGVLEEAGGRASTVRLRGGLREHLRFFHLTDPVILRKRTIEGTALKSDAALGVVSIEPLGVEIPMYDITTGTGDFIANGVVSHNCFARPTHEYLGLNIGEDFDRRIVVKVNAVERLRAEVAARRWAGHHIAMGTNTDPYQRCEGKYHLTQGVIKVLSEATNPFSILTKSTLILRDLDLLATAAERTSVRANLSIGTLDEDVWRLTEPGTPHPRRRVDAVRRLNEAGVPCGVLIGPVIPGMSDRPDQLKEVIDACAQAGAVTISAVSLHLRPGVREHYLSWLQTARPDLVAYYKERYGTRSYLPKAEQHALSTLVRDLVGQARARFSSPRQTRQMRQIGQEGFPDLSGDDDPPAAEPGQQLGFHL